jgi:uncharacterized protein
MRQAKVVFPCGSLILEGLCYYPDGAGPFPAVILCHPHPLYGGSMDSDVILTCASDLVDRSIIAFMFNFRGVGLSQGEFGDGIGEQDDVKAACSWIEAQKETSKGKIGLAGYSFGAMVGLTVACDDGRIKGLALISPALQPQQYADLQKCRIPKLLIIGSEDHISPPENAEQMFKAASDPKQFHLVPDADHFWQGHLKTVSGKVADFFSGLF